ncbi:MAG: ABC transporter ATP-binding protein/permease [Defluviitaleaceae bacterium]|nr:ABC transporter ATP-binding protein/permease [Defluviitaleaceae bacterium]
MKLLWRLGKEAAQYKFLYVVAIFSTFALVLLNLAAPRILAQVTGIVVDGVDEAGLSRIWNLAVLLTFIYLFRIAFSYMSNYLSHKAAWHLVEDLRVRVYEKIQSLSMSYFHDKQTGDLMSRTVNDTATFELLYAHIIPESITNIVTVLGVTIVLISINWQLALLTCIPIPFILYSGKIFATRIRPNFRKTQAALAGINSKLQDNYSGIQEIQSFNQEEKEAVAVTVKAKEFTKYMLFALKHSAVFHPIVEFISSVGTIIVVGFGGYLAFRNQLRTEDIVAFLLYLAMFYAPISRLGRLLEDIQQAFAGAERVIAVLDVEQEIKDAEDAKSLNNAAGSIEFRDVTFSYLEEIPVLKNINFKCEAGKMVALVGPTGVGKTTFVQLISRFYDPNQGSVYIDGEDVKSVKLADLRKNIAPVLQDTFLFNGTVMENIAYSAPRASEEEIIEAAKAARIHTSIMEMPEGYNTQVGERGVRLSGGQKQRIAIARAILRKAPVIILDEATASVDSETERDIQRAIDELSKTRTIIAIAHRLSTIQRADMILVLEEGEIVQQGSHEELVNEPGLYRRLHMAQNAGENAEVAGAN